ncbi:centrosomal protein of 104 kDa-like isoform X4 [Haliotis rufescens]|uniref:centrosomal protein of 104 kDa-like isoform X4 n=1 Tax=Haliotis rufescens TaxID=6454 RepID=UPI00201EEE10|nr:centrosomal protein of 104 kDa-like isoform X4 [Haliotis rufescens]
MPTKLQFRVVHVSGQDDSYRAAELNNHSPLTKGWQSSRFCLYPQDIVIQLGKRSRLCKIQILSHQFLIATKIEFYVGDVPDGVPLSLDTARYTRLGYVSLSDNEKTGYKARELKSVHVDAVGVYLKLNIHKNHVNKFNLYNQVGVIAINVIGDPLTKSYDPTDPEYLLDVSDNRIDKDPALDGYLNRPDYISPLDDLAFDMYQDPEIAQIIRRLERKKQEAVLQERYDYAKRLKHAIAELQKVGEKLGKMEVEKRQAVENEDYDKAKVKKLQMDEYRLHIYKDLNLPDLLETTGSRHPHPINFDSERQATPPRLVDIHRSPRSPPLTPPKYDERPLPITHRQPSPKPDLEPDPDPDPDSSQRRAYDERPLPIHKPPPVVEEEIEPEPEMAAGEPEPMTEKDIRDASSAIDVFGHPLVSKAYSKTWSYREDSLLAVYKQTQALPSSTPKEDAKAMMRAAIFLAKRAIDDKVYAVFKAALQLEKMILTDYVPKHKIPRQETISAVEKTIPNLLHKSGDTAVRNRDDTKKFIQDLSNFPEVRPTNVVPHECVKLFKPNMAPRLAQSRLEIVETLYKDLGLSTSGLNVDNLMPFCVEALNHNAGEVREVSERIIKNLYREVGAPVKDFLPPDDEKTRKNTLWRQLFEYFDKVDGKPSKSDQKKQRAEDEARKHAEIEALQKQLQQLKDMASGKAPIDQSMVKGAKKGAGGPAKSKGKPKSKVLAKTSEEDNMSIANMEKVCIFCGERNEGFNDEGLDLHYWKNCPMLKRCANCKQVVEIASLTDHLLSECESKAMFSKCPRCSEAILKEEYDQHVQEKACNPAKAAMNHCPLCHQDISNGEDGWKEHLMGQSGCKQNPRRLLALNKQPAQSRLPAPKSRVPTKTNKTGRR